ncbi:potassium voltage-gated channel protein Shaw-like [Haliotis cracherodii]|uniref:potassium voltage-gated channel protein Shaw-like n=1 Tax=Haliotis cracherodii TaxID=6455 RepID=UPI0039E89DAA
MSHKGSRLINVPTMLKGREKDSANVLHGLLPGARVNEANKKITIHTGTSNETVIFNVGGSRFETYRSTLNSLPFSKLADETFLEKYYREDKKDYFFDREPDGFKAILNYLRTGELHLPVWLCAASVKTELLFWGVEEDEIEECCWVNYSSMTTSLESLRKLEKDRKGTLGHIEENRNDSSSKWQRIRQKGWRFVNNPRSSLWAKVFGVVSMTFVVVSIFAFCAETHDSFHTSVTQPGSPMSLKNGSDVNDSRGVSDVYIHPLLFAIDVTCLTFFLLEFTTKFIFSPSKVKYFILPMTIIDIIALIPDIVETSYRLSTSDYYSRDTLDVLPVLRVTRVFRILRLIRHISGLWILFYTLKASLRELLLMMMFLFVGMLVYSSLIYFADDRSTFTSIPHGFWWALITMTTVGYGDMFPVTNVGYLVGSVTAVSGLLMIGFTVPVLVNNFLLYYGHTQSAMVREQNRENRIKRMEAQSRKRRPFSISSKVLPKASIIKNESVLASMAENASRRAVKLSGDESNREDKTKNEPMFASMAKNASKTTDKTKASTADSVSKTADKTKALTAESVSKTGDKTKTSTADSMSKTTDKTKTSTADSKSKTTNKTKTPTADSVSKTTSKTKTPTADSVSVTTDKTKTPTADSVSVTTDKTKTSTADSVSKTTHKTKTSNADSMSKTTNKTNTPTAESMSKTTNKTKASTADSMSVTTNKTKMSTADSVSKTTHKTKTSTADSMSKTTNKTKTPTADSMSKTTNKTKTPTADSVTVTTDKTITTRF